MKKRWLNGRPHTAGSRLMRKPWKFPLRSYCAKCRCDALALFQESVAVTELVINSCNICSPRGLCLASAISLGVALWSNLETLAIGHIHYGDAFNRQLIAPIRLGHLRNLKQLEISFCDSEMMDLSKAIESGNLPMLKTLNVSGNRLGIDGIIALAKAIKNGHLRCLMNLNLGQNKIGNAGCLALADAFGSRNAAQLVDLTLGRMLQTEDEGLILLASRLQSGHLNHLRILRIGVASRRWVPVYVLTPASSKAFVKAFQKNPLVTLSLKSVAYASESLKFGADKWFERNMKYRRAIEKNSPS